MDEKILYPLKDVWKHIFCTENRQTFSCPNQRGSYLLVYKMDDTNKLGLKALWPPDSAKSCFIPHSLQICNFDTSNKSLHFSKT